jgi:hypothetical protein
MIGISREISERYSEADLQRLFGKFGHQGEVRVRYARPNGDLTSPMPSSRHMSYVQKGWVAQEIVEPEAAAPQIELSIPDDVAEHARHDRIGIWNRGDEQIESSCRNALSLLAKGWTFVTLADQARRTAHAEAKPWPAASNEQPAHAAGVAPAAKGRK